MYIFVLIFCVEYLNIKKYAVEFWMIEFEVVFYDLKKVINLAVKLFKSVIKNIINKYFREFEYL